MKVIKFILETTDVQHIDLPKGAQILHVAPKPVMVESWLHCQHGEKQRVERVCLWALVDESAPTEPRTIFIHSDDNSVNAHAAFLAPQPQFSHDPARGSIVHGYLGTVHMADGTLVLHVFAEATYNW